MRTHAFVTLDPFTDQSFGDNPLAVFPDARGLLDAGMQASATGFNLSEATFMLLPACYCRRAAGRPETGRPSLLHVTARRRPDGIRATAGGNCVPVLKGEAMV